uniref:Tetraspanin n=1 Tax=Neogobius melanostomus TaxID=47308 RepID=A0A8C6SM09_9GOBI
MAQGCLRCLKFIMCAANFLCFVCGISVLGLGIYLSVNFKMAAITPSMADFGVAHILMITGIIITCVSFLGFLGALKENRCLLLTFFLMLFLLMLAELTSACLLLTHEIDGFLQRELKEGLKKAKQANTTILTDWDLVQRNLGCCGVINASDWQPNVPGPPNNSPALLPMDKEKKLPYVPESCCVDQCNESPPKYHQLGCYQKLKDYFEENFLYIGITIIVFCIIEVLGMCFAMTLFCHISRTGLGYKL